MIYFTRIHAKGVGSTPTSSILNVTLLVVKPCQLFGILYEVKKYALCVHTTYFRPSAT